VTSGDHRPVECDRLAKTLRDLRARSGLSLAALAAKTPYSKSSWERYLNGRTVPPRQAVQELCALVDEHPARPLALWELADAAWSGRAAHPGTAAPHPGQGPPGDTARPRRAHRRALVAGAVGALAVAGIAVPLLVTGALDGNGGRSPAAPAWTGVPGWAASLPGCHGAGCTGKDPEGYGCGIDPAPVTLGRQTFPGPTVIKIRYGAACGTVWARIDLGEVGDRVEILAPGRAPQHTEVKDRFDARASLATPMVDAVRRDLDRVRACLLRHGKRYCFGTAGDDGEG
jgi:hypothetical protein